MSRPPLIKHLLQVHVQEHAGGIQLLLDGEELPEAGIHLLKVLPGTGVSLQESDCVTQPLPTSTEQQQRQT